MAAGLVGVLFAIILRSTGDWRTGLDWERSLLLRIDRTAPALIDWVMLGLPWLGTNLTLVPFIAAWAIWVVRTRERIDLAVHLSAVVIGSLLLNAVLKAMYDRPRPQLWEHRGQYQWAAYPSGHAIVGTSVIFTMAYLLYRERGWRWPFVLAIALLLINIYSRMYLGVHWPTDVLGGLVIGLVWLVVTLYAFRTRRSAGRPSSG